MKKSEVNLKPAFFLINLLISLLLVSCSGLNPTYYDIPPELSDSEKKAEFINYYSAYIKNKKIFLDPGHGGEDRKNIGHLGLAVEADVNLRVALELRSLLIEAGADVEMSRIKDETVHLKARSDMANQSGSDIFISIHHNAPPAAGDNYTNYTSTYYHSTIDHFNYEPCEQDIAKYIQRDIAYVMRNSGGPGSFDGTYSDYSVYPGQGFAVLRLTNIPSVLVECGFHTHHIQEQRLADIFYNKIEAWGIFKGLCRYFKAGIPDIIFIKKELVESAVQFHFMLKDLSGIDQNSITVFIDSVKTNFDYHESTGLLLITLPNKKEKVTVRVLAANNNGNHSFPYSKEIMIKE